MSTRISMKFATFADNVEGSEVAAMASVLEFATRILDVEHGKVTWQMSTFTGNGTVNTRIMCVGEWEDRS